MTNGLGFGEIVVILVIALLVLGPDKLPQAGRAIGKAIRSVQKYVRDVTDEFDEIDELREIKKDVADIQNDLKTMGRNLEKSVEAESEKIETEAHAIEADLREAVEKPIKAGPRQTPEEEENTPADRADMTQQEDT